MFGASDNDAFVAGVVALLLIFAKPGVLLTRHFAERLRASPRIRRPLDHRAGVMLIGFGGEAGAGAPSRPSAAASCPSAR